MASEASVCFVNHSPPALALNPWLGCYAGKHGEDNGSDNLTSPGVITAVQESLGTQATTSSQRLVVLTTLRHNGMLLMTLSFFSLFLSFGTHPGLS